MTVRTRLVLAFTGTTLLLLLPAVFGATRLATLRDIASEQREQHARAFRSLGRLQASLTEFERFLRSYVATPEPELRERMTRSLAEARTRIETLDRLGYSGPADHVRAELEDLARATARIEALVTADSMATATDMLRGTSASRARAQAALDELAIAIDRRSRARQTQAQRISAAASTTMVLGILAALLVALGIGSWTTHALTSPLRRLRSAVAAVAGGRFTAPDSLPYDRHDEIGDLSRSFRTMAERLAELDRLKAEFLSMASHDLKTPINVIGGYAELLEDGVYGGVDDEQREALQSIREQTRVLTSLVNQLLDTGRIEAGTFRVEPEVFETREFFDTIRRTFLPLAQQKSVEFEIRTDASLPSVIEADPDRLRSEVLGNLLSNAFKFTPEGGAVRVHAGARDGHIRIEVSDSGPGIAPDELPRIFDRFYQIEGGERRKGTGLGLAIARDVVEAHGGTIEAESEMGHGTTFRISFPRRAHVAATPAEDA